MTRTAEDTCTALGDHAPCGGRAGRRISHQRRRLRSPGVQRQGDQSASFTLVTIFIKCAPAVSFLAPRRRTWPPHSCYHSHIPTSLDMLAGVPPQPDATGLPPQDYRSSTSPGCAARARLRRQAALAGRSCAARLRAIKYWCEADSSAKAQPASRDLCARISPARVCDSHTERHSERSVTLMISL